MKVLILYLALLGVTVSKVCNAQSCTDDEIELLSIMFSSCTNNASCFLDLCGCCTEALSAGISDSNYNCCLAYSSLLQCQVNNLPFCEGCLADRDVNVGSGFTIFELTSCYCFPNVEIETDPTTVMTTHVKPTSGKDHTSAAATMTLAVSGVMTLIHVYMVAL